MQVINENSALLSNYEVFCLLSDIKAGANGQRTPEKGHPATITYETLKYLENTPCALQSPEIIRKFLSSVEPLRLTKAEQLQLLNHRACTPVEIQLMIEESEERLNDDQLSDLINIVKTELPSTESQSELDDDQENEVYENGVDI